MSPRSSPNSMLNGTGCRLRFQHTKRQAPGAGCSRSETGRADRRHCGGICSTSLQQKLDELEARKAELERALQAAPRPRPLLHPRLADIYRQRVESLQTALDGPDASAALETLRSLIERVVLHPAPDGHRGFEIELVGEIAAMVALGADDKDHSRSQVAGHDAFHSSIKVVAGARNRRSHHSTVPI